MQWTVSYKHIALKAACKIYISLTGKSQFVTLFLHVANKSVLSAYRRLTSPTLSAELILIHWRIGKL